MEALDAYTSALAVLSAALLLVVAGLAKKQLVWRRDETCLSDGRIVAEVVRSSVGSSSDGHPPDEAVAGARIFARGELQ